LRLLVAAPGLGAPWTEGRKNLVRDLVLELSFRHEVMTITSGSLNLDGLASDWVQVQGRSRLEAILRLVKSTKTLLRDSQFDACLYFPHGTFTGARKVANEWSIATLRRASELRSTRFRTILYSIDGRPSKKAVIAADDVLASGGLPNGRCIPMGISIRSWPIMEAASSSQKRLLFMAGMTDRGELDQVLHKRGLATILQCGSELSSQGFTLRVAVPFLGSGDTSTAVMNSSINSWPDHAIQFDGVVSVPQVFSISDILVFAYTTSIQAFRPTSVMEAMMAGKPVVLPDHTWLRRHVDRNAATWFAPGDPVELLRAVLKADAEYAALAEKAFVYAHENFNIRATTQAILNHL